MTLPDECGWCGRALDEGEGLVPIWVGGPPETAYEAVDATVDDPCLPFQLRGRTAGELLALLDALRDCDIVEFDTCDVVREVEVGDQVVAGRGDEPPPPTEAPFNEELRRDKSGASVAVEPDPDWPDPDLEVCGVCAHSIRGEGGP